MLQAKKAKPKAKKKTKASKNVSFDSKKKKATDSDEDGSDSDKKKQGEPAKAAVPDFVDVLENKGSVTKIFLINFRGKIGISWVWERFYLLWKIMPDSFEDWKPIAFT